jgi:hypothetical protein
VCNAALAKRNGARVAGTSEQERTAFREPLCEETSKGEALILGTGAGGFSGGHLTGSVKFRLTTTGRTRPVMPSRHRGSSVARYSTSPEASTRR